MCLGDVRWTLLRGDVFETWTLIWSTRLAKLTNEAHSVVFHSYTFVSSYKHYRTFSWIQRISPFAHDKPQWKHSSHHHSGNLPQSLRKAPWTPCMFSSFLKPGSLAGPSESMMAFRSCQRKIQIDQKLLNSIEPFTVVLQHGMCTNQYASITKPSVVIVLWAFCRPSAQQGDPLSPSLPTLSVYHGPSLAKNGLDQLPSNLGIG